MAKSRRKQYYEAQRKANIQRRRNWKAASREMRKLIRTKQFPGNIEATFIGI